jgi:DNA-binding NarL/FixJ family response regulator
MAAKRLAAQSTQPDIQAARMIGYAPNRVVLSGRQLVVAQLVAIGLEDKEIANFLHVSQGTVKSCVSMILQRLALRRRTQICRYIHEMGLFP